LKELVLAIANLALKRELSVWRGATASPPSSALKSVVLCRFWRGRVVTVRSRSVLSHLSVLMREALRGSAALNAPASLRSRGSPATQRGGPTARRG